MTLTLGPILLAAGIAPAEALVIRHAYVKVHEDTGLKGIDADSTDDEILAYTRQQSAKPRVFPVIPPRIWVVFIREGGDRARLWSVLENRGEMSNDGRLRTFELARSEQLVGLRNRLVIGWRSPPAGGSMAPRPRATQSWRLPTRNQCRSPASIGSCWTTRSFSP